MLAHSFVGCAVILLNGLAGNDTLSGGAGADIIIGGAGLDVLTGGAGSDTFQFGSLSDFGTGTISDVIADFSASDGDSISLAGIDANTTAIGDQSFSFVNAFTTTHANYEVAFKNGLLQINTDNDTAAEYSISLTGVSTFSSADLIL